MSRKMTALFLLLQLVRDSHQSTETQSDHLSVRNQVISRCCKVLFVARNLSSASWSPEGRSRTLLLSALYLFWGQKGLYYEVREQELGINGPASASRQIFTEALNRWLHNCHEDLPTIRVPMHLSKCKISSTLCCIVHFPEERLALEILRLHRLDLRT